MNILCTSKVLDSHLRPLIRLDIEEVWAVALASNLSLISSAMIFRGHASGCSIHAREIFRFAIQQNAVHLAIAHSHPSGDPEPSPEDLSLTQNLYEISRWLRIPLIEHLIISKESYSSMSDSGYFEKWRKKRQRKFDF